MTQCISSPLVTVYIPTCNRPSLVRRAVESVLSQTYEKIEIIVVDDGFDTPAEDALSDLITSRSIKYLRNEAPSGAQYSRNKAIENAKGTFITGLDDDDFFVSNRIEELLAHTNEKYSFVSSGYRVIYEDFERAEHNSNCLISMNDILRSNIVGNQVLVRTSYLRDLGGFDKDLPAWQDYDMWIRLIRKYGSGIRVGQPLYVVDKSHPHERISGKTDKVDKAYSLFIAKHCEYRSKKYRSYLKISHMHYHLDDITLMDMVATFFGGAYKRSLGLMARKYGVKS